MAGEHQEIHNGDITRNSLLETEKKSAAEKLLSSACEWISDNQVDIGIAAVAIASVGAAGLARKLFATAEGAELLGIRQATDTLERHALTPDLLPKFSVPESGELGGRIIEKK